MMFTRSIVLGLALFGFTAMASHGFEHLQHKAHHAHTQFEGFLSYSSAVPQGPFFQNLNRVTHHAIGDIRNLEREVSKHHPHHHYVHELCDHTRETLNQWLSTYAQGEGKLAAEKKPGYAAVYQAGLRVKPAIYELFEACDHI
jgi:hypothetical protein